MFQFSGFGFQFTKMVKYEKFYWENEKFKDTFEEAKKTGEIIFSDSFPPEGKTKYVHKCGEHLTEAGKKEKKGSMELHFKCEKCEKEFKTRL